MKKAVFGFAMMMATASVNAQNIDLTPSNYKYAERNVGQQTISKFFNGANVPAPCDALVSEAYDNGLFVVAGGQFANPAQPYATDLQAGTSIVDLGGEVGKVLCINGAKSKFNEKFGMDYPKCTGNLNWFNFNWFMDPKNSPVDGGKEDADRNIRVRVVLNVFANKADEAAEIVKAAYMVTNQGNVMPANSNTADGVAITTGDFIETYEDDGTPVEDENGNYVYDPTKWMVYEWDTYCPEPDDDKLSTPLRLKMDMHQANLTSSTVFIKEISFTKLVPNEDPIAGNTRRKTVLKLTVDPQTVATAIGSIHDTANGVKEIYTLGGTRVNANAQLPQGVYIVKEGDKTVKMVIR